MAAARPSIEQLLDREVDELDGLLGDVRGGIRNAGHFDELEGRCNAIARRLLVVFRTGERS